MMNIRKFSVLLLLALTVMGLGLQTGAVRAQDSSTTDLVIMPEKLVPIDKVLPVYLKLPQGYVGNLDQLASANGAVCRFGDFGASCATDAQAAMFTDNPVYNLRMSQDGQHFGWIAKDGNAVMFTFSGTGAVRQVLGMFDDFAFLSGNRIAALLDGNLYMLSSELNVLNQRVLKNAEGVKLQAAGSTIFVARPDKSWELINAESMLNLSTPTAQPSTVITKFAAAGPNNFALLHEHSLTIYDPHGNQLSSIDLMPATRQTSEYVDAVFSYSGNKFMLLLDSGQTIEELFLYEYDQSMGWNLTHAAYEDNQRKTGFFFTPNISAEEIPFMLAIRESEVHAMSFGTVVKRDIYAGDVYDSALTGDGTIAYLPWVNGMHTLVIQSLDGSRKCEIVTGDISNPKLATVDERVLVFCDMIPAGTTDRFSSVEVYTNACVKLGVATHKEYFGITNATIIDGNIVMDLDMETDMLALFDFGGNMLGEYPVDFGRINGPYWFDHQNDTRSRITPSGLIDTVTLDVEYESLCRNRVADVTWDYRLRDLENIAPDGTMPTVQLARNPGDYYGLCLWSDQSFTISGSINGVVANRSTTGELLFNATIKPDAVRVANGQLLLLVDDYPFNRLSVYAYALP